MNNMLLISLSRQIAMQRQMDVVANNVANVSTNGFKRRTAHFAEHMMPGARGDNLSAGDKTLSFVADRGESLDLSAGSIEKSGNPLDVAIRGEGMLVVQAPGGERYTRNGALSLGAAGELVTSDGHPVLSEGGPLTFSVADGEIAIAADGTVSTAQGVRGKLRLVRFDNPQGLQNAGANLFSSNAPAQPAGAAARLEAGALERSNVSPVGEIARMIEINRSYSSLAQMMQRGDELRRSALSRLADNA